MQVTGRRWRMPFARWTMSQPGAWGCLGPGREHPERAAPVELPLLVSFASKASGFAVGGAGRCGHWSVVSDQWSAEVGESRNTAVNRIRFRGPVHCPLGGGAWKWGRDSPWKCFQSFASRWKVVGCRKSTRRKFLETSK